MQISLQDFERTAKYYEGGPSWVRSIWPSMGSFRWFVKSNREILQKQGALRNIGRDNFIVKPRFEDVVKSKFGLQVGEQTK